MNRVDLGRIVSPRARKSRPVQRNRAVSRRDRPILFSGGLANDRRTLYSIACAWVGWGSREGTLGMARTKRSANGDGKSEPRPPVVVEEVPLAEATRSRYLNYALSVITSRALPDVRDGLKPVQRRILYALYHDLHITSESRFIKSAAVVGEAMKNYHPHGDQSIYDALVRMAQPFSLRYPAFDRRLRQLRLDRRRPARRVPVHRVPPDADRRELLSETPRPDGRPPPQLRLDHARSPKFSPRSFPTSWSTGRRGSPSGWPPTSRRTTSAKSARP